MNNSSLIQVKVQNLNEDKKTIKERRLIYQKIKPFMEAYGLQPELFQLKGKSIVFKSNNSINTSHLSRSGVTSKSVIIPNKARKISVKKKNQNPQRQIIAPMDYQPLTISEKYAQLFAELQQHDNSKTASAIQQSAIPEEADEITDNSTMKKQVLSEIAELDQIKQQKLEEVQNLEQKIQELQSLENNILSNRQFVIRQPTLRQKKDKAASLIQAHIKGRIDQKRYQEWKQKKEQKLKKLIKIQQWWKHILRKQAIIKKFQLTHIKKQIKEIRGYTFIIFSNYSHPLKRIRILLVQRNGLIKQDLRFYINFENIETILQEQPLISSFEFNNLLDLITNSLFKILQINNNQIEVDLILKNVFYIDRLMLSVDLQIAHLQNNQYEIIIAQNLNQQSLNADNYDQEQDNPNNQVEDDFQYTQKKEVMESQQVHVLKEKQQSPLQTILILDTTVIKEQEILYLNEKEIKNREKKEDQEKLNEDIQINDHQNEILQSQSNVTKPGNEEQQIEFIPKTQNCEFAEQKQESPKPDQCFRHQFQEETINSQFVESNFQLVNIPKEISQFDDYQSNKLNDEQQNLIIDGMEKSQNQANAQDKSTGTQIQDQNQVNFQAICIQDQNEQKADLKLLDLEGEQINDYMQMNKIQEFQEGVYQKEIVESTANHQLLTDLKADQQIQQKIEINVQSENQSEVQNKAELENNNLEQNENYVNNSIIVPQAEFNSVPQSPDIFLQNQNNNKVLTLPNTEFQLMKSCNSNFDPPINFQETNKLLNSNELLLKSENQGFTVFKQNDVEVNSLLQSEELRRDFSFPAPVNLRHQQQSRKSSTQIQEIPEPQSPQVDSKANSELRKSQTEDMFKQSIGTTFRVTFNSEFRASVSGFFQSQQFDLTIRQQDSLQYSMDESQEIQPIYITTVQLDDDEIDVYQINDKLRFMDKKGKYMHYDYQIQTIAQSNCDYINNNLYIYAINRCLKCLEGCQVLRIQKFVMKYQFVQSCYMTFDHQPYLAILYKSYIRMKIEIHLDNNIFKEIILNNCCRRQRQQIKQYFSQICPQILIIQSNYKDVIISVLEQLEKS